MSKYQRRHFQVGEWFLGTKAGRPGWFRCKFESGQTRRISLGTLDLEEAKRRLAAWFLAEQQGPPPDGNRATLAEVLVAYDEAHGQHVASAADVKISSRLWADYFGDIAAADVDVDRIDKFKQWLSAKDYSPGYINRVLSVGRAALIRAFERGVIPRRPVVKGVPGHEPEPKGRPMSVPELRALYASLHEPHLRRFFLLGLGTGARPDALKTLEWPQVHLEGHTIALNPPGRTQTKKRRAKVPICNRLAELLKAWGAEDRLNGPLVHFRGKALGSVKTSWRKARAAAGIGDGCNPYSLRHTVAKWLRSQGVPPWEVAALLGHRLPGYSVTEAYASADPAHMAATKAALDKLLTAVIEGGTRVVIKGGSSERAESVPLISAKSLMSGCSSGVEHHVANVRVEGSNPFARSNFTDLLRRDAVPREIAQEVAHAIRCTTPA